MSFAKFLTEHDILINACLYLFIEMGIIETCLLYTSDAADE